MFNKLLCSTKRLSFKIIAVLITFLCFFLILQCAFNNRVAVRHYTIKTDKLGANTSVRAVVLSDLHSTIHGNNQQSLIDKIVRQNPDVILLAGDIADDNAPFEGTRLLLEGIHDLCPVYYVTGNHEYWHSDVQWILEQIESLGVTILSDEYEEIEINRNTILIAGVEDPERWRFDRDYVWENSIDEAFCELTSSDTFKFLIAHRPERIETYVKYPFDLVVSGHTHGGQVRIPFILNGLIAPDQDWHPEYSGGLYKFNELFLIISRGLSINPRLPRIFNPPEIVVIDILGLY